jgi:methionine synthase I (cobalamin-dependent)
MGARVCGGPMGTELARRGFALAAPAWSAAANLHAPELVAAIHRDHVAAGAEQITANTTCAHRHDVGDAQVEICRVAIDLARRSGVRVAASLAMLPAWMSPERRALEYAAAATAMRGADVLLLEGFIDADELVRALEATRGWPGSRWAALAGPGAAQLPALVPRALAEHVALVAVHCCALADAAAALSHARARFPGAPLGAYPSPEGDDLGFAQALVELAVRIDLAWIGSCCGGTPATTAALVAARDR